MNGKDEREDPRLSAIPDTHGHAKGEHKPYAEERPIPLTARMLFLWFYHACRRGSPRFLMVADHMNYLTFEDPAAVNLVRRALKLAAAGDLYGAAETAGVDVGHTAVVSEGLRRGMRYSIGAEVDNDHRSRPDAQNIVDAMKPDGLIRSVHFLTIDHPTEGPNFNWPFDNPEFVSLYEHVGTDKTWELYMATLLDAIERLPGHIIGHFYVPANFGHWPDAQTLERYEDQMLDAALARGMAVELNTRFLYRDHPPELQERYRQANLRLMRKAKAKGVGIAVGSDAHSPRDQGNAFDQVLQLLDEAEVNELVFPIGGRLARVALRATKELLERAAGTPALAPPPPPKARFDDDEDDDDGDGAEAETAPAPPEEAAPAASEPAAPPAIRKPRVAARKPKRAPVSTELETAQQPASEPAPAAEPETQTAPVLAHVHAPPKKKRPATRPAAPASGPEHPSAAPEAAVTADAAPASSRSIPVKPAAKASAPKAAATKKPAPAVRKGALVATAAARKPPVKIAAPAAKNARPATKAPATKSPAAKAQTAKTPAVKAAAAKAPAKPAAKRTPAKAVAKAPARPHVVKKKSATKKSAVKPAARPARTKVSKAKAAKTAPKRALKPTKKPAPAKKAAAKKAASKRGR